MKLGKAFSKALYIISAAAGTILMTLGGAYASAYNFAQKWDAAAGFIDSTLCLLFNPIFALVAGAILFLFGATGTYLDQARQQEELTTLRKENESLSRIKNTLNALQEELQLQKSKVSELHGELAKSWIMGAYKVLELNNNERVTIYYEYDEEFYLLARHSKNPKFSKIHRQKFPLNQGVISSAWQNELCVETDCPQYKSGDNYISYFGAKYGYSAEKLRELTMHSCRYLAKAIIDADIHIGVIVFESTDENFLKNDDQIERIITYCDNHQGRLSKFVRDALDFDKEVNLKRKGIKQPIEDELMKELGGTI